MHVQIYMDIILQLNQDMKMKIQKQYPRDKN